MGWMLTAGGSLPTRVTVQLSINVGEDSMGPDILYGGECDAIVALTVMWVVENSPTFPAAIY